MEYLLADSCIKARLEICLFAVSVSGSSAHNKTISGLPLTRTCWRKALQMSRDTEYRPTTLTWRERRVTKCHWNYRRQATSWDGRMMQRVDWKCRTWNCRTKKISHEQWRIQGEGREGRPLPTAFYNQLKSCTKMHYCCIKLKINWGKGTVPSTNLTPYFFRSAYS